MINPQSLDISSLPSVSLQNRKDLPKTPSIYFAIDSQGTIQYIGRSVNPRNRWANHQRTNQLEDNCRIAWLDCDESLLNGVEEALISFFNPPLNGFSRSLKSVTTDKHLKQLRQQQRLTTADVASHLGISDATVRNWEHARSVPRLRLSQFKELACIYKVTLDELESSIKETLENGVTFND